MNATRIIIATLLLLIAGRAAHGHGVPIRIKIDDASNQVLRAPFERGHISDDPTFGLIATLPGIGAQTLPNGLPVDEIVGLDVTQGLLYWDGSMLVATDAEIKIQSADFIDQYVVDADSPRQAGMRWAEYDGTSNWHAHGIYFLMPSSAATGIYGLAFQIILPDAIPSDPFLVPLVYDPVGEWSASELEAGIALLQSALIMPSPGDFNRDWIVDAADHDLWMASFGRSMAPFLAADGNGDGRVSAADYTVWRDHLGAPGSGSSALLGPLAVPEAPSWLVLTIGVVVLLFVPRWLGQRPRKRIWGGAGLLPPASRV